MLQDAGVDKITIMDSAGTMFPEEAAAYTKALKAAASIPVGFHGHSNLGLSQANALAAAAEQLSEHPLGKAVVRCFRQEAAAALPPVERFAMLPGEGVTAVVGGICGAIPERGLHRHLCGAE